MIITGYWSLRWLSQKDCRSNGACKGRTMTVYSDQPGMQFYAGNCISPHKGKANAEYGKRCGLALETQAYPDSVNRENFPDVIYGPDREYKTTTIYKLSW